MLCSLATKLDRAELEQVSQLEQELGHPLLAFSCHPVDPAHIDDEQLAKIKNLESKLGVSLVAVNA